MRKIISKENEGKKRKRNQLIVGGILILVMILSTIGYSLNSNNSNGDSNRLIYNNIEFTQTSGVWNANFENYQFSFKNNPNEVGKVNSSLNLLNSYQDKPLYIYSEDSNSETEIYRNLFYQNKIALRVQEACPESETCTGDVPSKTCSDNFIIIKQSNSSSIEQDKNCVFIEGKSDDLIKLSDSFLYKITGIQ
jgi:hypothetical protein